MKNVFLLILFFLFINHSSAQTIDEYRNVVEYFRYNKELRKQLKYLTRSKKLIYQKDKGIKFKVSPQIIRVHYSNFENQINEFNIFNKNLDINDFAAISMRDLENRRLKKLQSLSTDGSSRLILFFSEAYKNTLTGEFFIISTYPTLFMVIFLFQC